MRGIAKKSSVLLFTLLMISACSTNSKMLVSSGGKAVRCHSAGMGIVGVITSGNAFDKCVENYMGLGYVDINDAGLTGIKTIGKKDDQLVVLAVSPASPAANAGIVPGDKIIEIANGIVLDPTDAISRLFGKIDSDVNVKLKSVTGAEKVVTLKRVAFKSLRGASSEANPES